MFPKINDQFIESGVFSSDTSNWTLEYPKNIKAGDLLIAILSMDGGTGTVSFPSGWQIKNIGTAPSSAMRLFLHRKFADGSESGLFSITNPSQQGCWAVFRITGAHPSEEPAITIPAATGTNNSPNPPSLNPSGWDIEKTLWIAACGADMGNGVHNVIGVPTGYNSRIVLNSGGTDGTSMGIADLKNEVASEDPSPFTLEAIAGSKPWVAFTIAVRPKP